MKLPRLFAAWALSACSPPGGGGDAGRDAGCTLPTDFPADASTELRQGVCECFENAFYHCYVEGGPRCDDWFCNPKKSSDGGYVTSADGGTLCLC
jgi:hypothetical protein